HAAARRRDRRLRGGARAARAVHAGRLRLSHQGSPRAARSGGPVLPSGPRSVPSGNRLRLAVITAALALLGAIGGACGGSTSTTTVAATVTATQAAGTVTVTVAGGESSPGTDTADDTATTAAGGVSAVAVQKKGFSQKKQDVGYGIVLRNLSATQDA